MQLYFRLIRQGCIALAAFSLLPVFAESVCNQNTSKQHKIIEVMSFYPPGDLTSLSIKKTLIMPELNAIGQFGGMDENNSNTKNRIQCGPSPEINTLNCFNFSQNGGYLQSFPIPGKSSSAPIFSDNSWLIGTSKGFLMRVNANPNNYNLPNLNLDNYNLWGSQSRHVMANFQLKPIYVDHTQNQEAPDPQTFDAPKLTQGIQWIFPASSSFIGVPKIRNGLVYIFSSSQYFQAFDWETGKLTWALRLAPVGDLRLNSNSFEVTENELFVGNSLGTLFSLNPKTGAVNWTWEVPQATDTQRAQFGMPAGPDKFVGIVGAPLITKNSVIISNAESMTQSLSINNHNLQWSFPMGSVTKPILYQNNILIGLSSGKLASLNAETGAVNWIVPVINSNPISTLYLTENNLLFAATHSGKMFLINPNSGEILSHSIDIGEIVGSFFKGVNKNEVCLNFVANGFRCFRGF